MNECQRVELAAGQPSLDLFGVDGRTPIDLQRLSLPAAPLGDIEPFV